MSATRPPSRSSVALTEPVTSAKRPWNSAPERWLRSPSAMAFTGVSTSVRKRSMVSQMRFTWRATCSRFSSAPCGLIRREKSPSAALAAVSSIAARIARSSVRSSHSTTVPMRWPRRPKIGLTTRFRRRSPRRMSVISFSVMSWSLATWWLRLRWKMWKSTPISFAGSNCGTILRMPSPARSSNWTSEGLT